MTLHKRSVIILLLLSFFAGGCVTASRTSLREVKSAPQEYSEKTIHIEGIVTDTMNNPFKRGGMYRIFEDKKDSLWIETKEDLPARGSVVRVSGKVVAERTVKNRLMGPILLEEERKIREGEE